MTEQITKDTASLSIADTPKRRPYFGSCHCKKIRYIAYLTLPLQPPYTWTDRSKPPPPLVRKCNCTICHKFGMFHVRLANAPKDFILLSPLDPLKELTNYKAASGAMNNLFCPTCGARCFIIEGPEGKDVGIVVERDLKSEGIDLDRAKVEGDGSKVKAFVPNPDGWREEETNWLRINAQSFEPDQEGLDLREWHEKKWVQYVNWLDEVPGPSLERPFHGGTY